MNISSLLNRFEEAVCISSDPIRELAQITSPDILDFLFQLRLRKSLKSGPKSGIDEAFSPSRLIILAHEAECKGLVAISTSHRLRQYLFRQEEFLKNKKAWNLDSPMWWHPLPPESQLEQSWKEFDYEFSHVGFEGFSENSGNNWLWLPNFLMEDQTRAIYQELETGFDEDSILLEREGVGGSNRLSSSRSDSVKYTTGFEPELLATNPILAMLVQMLRAKTTVWLRQIFPDYPLAAPQSAMLARYPAPSEGYHAHFDNPGGENDNGRTYTLVVYLNSTEETCQGGEIAVWKEGLTDSSQPTEVFQPGGGAALLFDSRKVPHQVLPLKAGPARWALTIWFNDKIGSETDFPPLPELSITDLLLPLQTPVLPPELLLFHELDDQDAKGKMVLRNVSSQDQRVAIVSTVYQSGKALLNWCLYHYSIGIDQLVLIFDHLEEISEQALANEIKSMFDENQLTIWSGSEARKRWRLINSDPHTNELIKLADFGGSSYAISARQTLNASAALEAAKNGEFGYPPIDWLLHLDDDERFFLQGRGRGGESVHQHFSTLSNAGIRLARYLNHEFLACKKESTTSAFKLNPRMAAAVLGTKGWQILCDYLSMHQTDERPYFNAYLNGKSAVSVKHAKKASGMHSWVLIEESTEEQFCFLAGPSVLHFRFRSSKGFRKKYKTIAESERPKGGKLFDYNQLENHAVALTRELINQGALSTEIDARLEELFKAKCCFSESEIDLLSKAGLLFEVDLD